MIQMDTDREALLRRVIAWRKGQEEKKAADAKAALKVARLKAALDPQGIKHQFKPLAWYIEDLTIGILIEELDLIPVSQRSEHFAQRLAEIKHA